MAKKKISFLQRVGYILEYAVVVPLGFFISLLPWAFVPVLSRVFGWFLFHIDTRDKNIAYGNFKIIYKDKLPSVDEQNAILRKLFRNVARVAIELLKIKGLRADNYERFARMEGYENVEKAVAMGKGLIVITAHLGNWEFLGSVPAKLGRDVVVIINRQFNPYTDAWIRNNRERNGKLRCLYNEIGDLTRIMKHLKHGGIVAIVADQTYYFRPIFVPFFGLPAATADGPARFHLKYRSPIIMAFGLMQDDGKYLLKYDEPKTFEPTGDNHKDTETIMAWVNSRYEEYILKYPDQWFSLMHARWAQNKPEDFPDNPDDYPH